MTITAKLLQSPVEPAMAAAIKRMAISGSTSRLTSFSGMLRWRVVTARLGP